MEMSARYILKNPLSYATRDGETTEAEFLEMNAPSGRHSKQTAGLRQGIVRAIIEDQDRAAKTRAAMGVPEEPDDPNQVEADDTIEVAEGGDIVNVLARSSVDLGALYHTARDLFTTKGILKVDGSTQMTATLLDRMSAQDFEFLVGSYIANFILAS